MIEVICSACGFKFTVQEENAGKTEKCPNCQEPIQIPMASRDQILDPIPPVSGKDPSFNAPAGKKRLKGKVFIALGIIVILVILNLLGRIIPASGHHTQNKPGQTATATSQPKALIHIDKSLAKQQGRKVIIDFLKTKGFFSRIVQDPKQGVKIWVAPSFTSLSRDQKETFASVIYCYYFDGKKITDTVHFLDKNTDKEIDAYGMTIGGLKMK